METNFLTEFAHYLAGLKKEPFVEDNKGRQYRLGDYSPIRESAPDALRVETLSAVKHYLEDIPDPNAHEELFLHIEDYQTVSLKTTFRANSFCERRTLLVAKTPDLAQENGIFTGSMAQSEFIIALNTLFAESTASFVGADEDDRSYLLRVASRITAQASAETVDNGMSQDTTLKRQTRGNLTQDESIRPIVSLRPYRSFREVEPVEGLFNFRLVPKEEKPPGLKLVVADGGAWKLATVLAVKQHLTETLGITIPIIA